MPAASFFFFLFMLHSAEVRSKIVQQSVRLCSCPHISQQYCFILWGQLALSDGGSN